MTTPAVLTPGIKQIRLVSGDEIFVVHGDDFGDRGVVLAEGQVKGLYDAPVQTTYKSGAFTEGSRQKWVFRRQRDLQLGFYLLDTITDTFEWNESEFRKIFAYELDPWSLDPQPTTIEVETGWSGTRKLDVLMFEEPEFSPDQDPLMNQFGNLILKLRAGQPFWYEDDVISSYGATDQNSQGQITISNPTDQIMYQKFVITPATWTLPDVQWVGEPGARTPGGPNANRSLSGITITPANGGAVIDLDRSELMYRDSNNTNLLGQMGGRRLFNFAIPPYTPPTPLPVSYTGAPVGGAMVQCRQPRRWSRPWGLET